MKDVRVWLITGTSSGFGRSLARAVIDRGERVIATARNVSDIADLRRLDPDRVHLARLDVTDTDSIRTTVAAAKQTFGRIDVLVNNAGYGLLGAFEELTDVEMRVNFETNFFGMTRVCREVLPLMREQRSGHIVQMSSVIGVVPGPGGTAYAGTKFALEGFSEALAREVTHLGIGVTIVEPGPFRTEASGRSVRWGTSMTAYANVMGPARAALEASHDSQTGDPDRGASAIIAALDCESPPLRLPLGPQSFDWIRTYLTSRLDELGAVESLGADTSFR